MEIQSIIRELDTEIARLQQVRALLTGTGSSAKAGRPAKRKYTLSPEARKRIVDAQRKRWAAQKKAAKKAA
jgi:fructoselysine-6-P-deglycase FrlB-like protein